METNNREIIKLTHLLEEAGIPFKYTDNLFSSYGISEDDSNSAFGYQVIIERNGKRLCDAVFHFSSYGSQEGLLEIMGGLTDEEGNGDSVLGYLTAQEVFERFKYCYEHKTSIYKENNI